MGFCAEKKSLPSPWFAIDLIDGLSTLLEVGDKAKHKKAALTL